MLLCPKIKHFLWHENKILYGRGTTGVAIYDNCLHIRFPCIKGLVKNSYKKDLRTESKYFAYNYNKQW